MNKILMIDKLLIPEEKNKLGIMRIDWADGALANKWKPADLLINLNNKNKIDLKQLQKELNYIQFELLNDFSKVEKLCGGVGIDLEKMFYIQMELARYAIRLTPERGWYSYIFVYRNE